MLPSPRSPVSPYVLQSAQETLTPQYRRDGKLQACETCRKSKLKCDHVMPTCGRCSRRGQKSRCVYLTTPGSQKQRKLLPRTSSSLPVDHVSTTPVQSRIDCPTPSTIPRSRAQSAAGISGEREASPCADLGRRGRSIGLDLDLPLKSTKNRSTHDTTGFLGATSFQSVFTENLPQFGIALEDASQAEEDTLCRSDGDPLEGIKVISLLKYRNLFCKQLAAGEDWGYLDPLLRTWYEAIWTSYGDILQSGNEARLRDLVTDIFSNTARKIEINASMTMRDFASSTSGINLRWETVGVLIAEIAIHTKTAHSQDTVWQDDGEKLDRKDFLGKCTNAVDKCLTFCGASDRLHDLYLWLLEYSDGILSVMQGETALSTYLRGGEVISLAISLGLHQSSGDANTPRFLREIRKCMFMSILTIECRRSMTLGRPPRLHYKYCKIPDMLDIHASVWLQPEAEIDQSINELVNGWNPHKKLYCSTWIRRQILVVKRRQQLMDLALMDRTQAEVVYEAEAIRAKMEADLAGLPSDVIDFVEGEDPPTDNAIEKFCRRAARMNDMSDRLSLQRILVQKAGVDSRTLIPYAKKLMEQVIHQTTATEIAQYVKMSTVLINYGIRAAAILALELLREQSGPQRSQSSVDLPRSRTIQDLSVFIFCCEQGSVGENSRQVCQQAAIILRRVLDRILDPQPIPVPPVNSVNPEIDGRSVPPMGMFEDILGMTQMPCQFDANVNLIHDVDFSNWLASVSWSLGPSDQGWTGCNNTFIT